MREIFAIALVIVGVALLLGFITMEAINAL